MRTFTDTLGRQWNIEINVRLVKTVREATDTLLTALFDNDCQLFGELTKDVIRLVDILWICCERQATTLGVTEVEFAESLGGDALGDATEALARACADFFSSQDQRDGLNEVLTLMNRMAKTLATTATNQIRNIDIEQLERSCMDSALSTQG